MLKLGIVTYQIAQDWDLETIIKKCSELGYEGVELRTTHAHKVEVNLSEEERKEVKKKFADSPVKLVGLGSAFEYHSPDKEELKKNIEGTKEYIKLASDVGAAGVKVRPNAFPQELSKEKTIEQIGSSLREVSSFASNYGIKIRLEVHGEETSLPPYIKKMLDVANHHNLYACWNSNNFSPTMTDMDKNGSIEDNFNLLKERIGLVHINELWNEYPWKKLFFLLKDSGYDGFCLAEIPTNPEPERLLRYYHALFKAYSE
ncbi:unnamed protein product [marine sediment metagenome]|uniref:Xylose isomerase-like TIM barrel domain-containing protein n=1 Tax=marine sediment metagenome TaxID=412755 RepID=X0YEZ3_9ZZZZ